MLVHCFLTLADFLRTPKELCGENVIIKKFVEKSKKFFLRGTVVKEQELKKFTSINGREIIVEEKNKIFDFLEQHELPNKLYPIALNRYLDGTLELEQKVNIRKSL